MFMDTIVTNFVDFVKNKVRVRKPGLFLEKKKWYIRRRHNAETHCFYNTKKGAKYGNIKRGM